MWIKLLEIHFVSLAFVCHVSVVLLIWFVSFIMDVVFKEINLPTKKTIIINVDYIK